jgi:hypothetical protein
MSQSDGDFFQLSVPRFLFQEKRSVGRFRDRFLRFN